MNKWNIATYGVLNIIILFLVAFSAYEKGQVQKWEFGYQLMEEFSNQLATSVLTTHHTGLICSLAKPIDPYRIKPKHFEESK